jgi:hypothetical protein
MRKNYASLKQYLLALTLLTIIINSCKKGEDKSIDFSAIENAKNWFSKSEKGYLPDWDKAIDLKSNNINYIVLPSNYSLRTDKNKITSKLVIADSLGNYSAKIIEFINSNAPDALEDIVKIYKSDYKLKKLSSNYTGSLLVLNSDHTYLYGLQLQNGYIKHNLKIGFKSDVGGSLKDRLLMTLQPPPDVPVCTDWYWTSWDATTGAIYSETYLYTTCPGDIIGSGSNSSTNGTINDPNDQGIPRDIDVNIKNACLSSVYEKIAGDLNNDVTKILMKTFGENSRINLKIIDLSYDGSPAKTFASNPKTKDGIKFIDVKLTLNTQGLPSNSQEYIATTILHEIIHAYLDSEGTYVNNQYMQHIEIGENFVDLLRESVQSNFTLTDKQANSLILNGMGDIMQNKPDYYTELLNHYNLTPQNVYDTTQTFKNKTNGTYCK